VPDTENIGENPRDSVAPKQNSSYVGQRIGKKKRTQTAPKYLTTDEITAFFKVINRLRDRALFRVIYHRGLRAHEPGRLRLCDFQNREGKLHVVRGKGSTGGEFRLVEEEVKALRAYIRYERGNAAGPLFPARNGRALGRWQVWSLMKRYAQAAGIDPEKGHPHALKHSCGTHLAEMGEDLLDIQDHLGHRNIANTRRYIEVTNKRRDAAAERLKAWR
jgi:integrase/recombinase XerD